MFSENLFGVSKKYRSLNLVLSLLSQARERSHRIQRRTKTGWKYHVVVKVGWDAPLLLVGHDWHVCPDCPEPGKTDLKHQKGTETRSAVAQTTSREEGEQIPQTPRVQREP